MGLEITYTLGMKFIANTKKKSVTGFYVNLSKTLKSGVELNQDLV